MIVLGKDNQRHFVLNGEELSLQIKEYGHIIRLKRWMKQLNVENSICEIHKKGLHGVELAIWMNGMAKFYRVYGPIVVG